MRGELELSTEPDYGHEGAARREFSAPFVSPLQDSLSGPREAVDLPSQDEVEGDEREEADYGY